MFHLSYYLRFKSFIKDFCSDNYLVHLVPILQETKRHIIDIFFLITTVWNCLIFFTVKYI